MEEPTEDEIKPFDVVALTVDLPELNLRRGQVGTVVDVHTKGQVLEVEFSDRNGRIFASLGLSPDQILALRYASEVAPADFRA